MNAHVVPVRVRFQSRIDPRFASQGSIAEVGRIDLREEIIARSRRVLQIFRRHADIDESLIILIPHPADIRRHAKRRSNRFDARVVRAVARYERRGVVHGDIEHGNRSDSLEGEAHVRRPAQRKPGRDVDRLLLRSLIVGKADVGHCHDAEDVVAKRIKKRSLRDEN